MGDGSSGWPHDDGEWRETGFSKVSGRRLKVRWRVKIGGGYLAAVAKWSCGRNGSTGHPQEQARDAFRRRARGYGAGARLDAARQARLRTPTLTYTISTPRRAPRRSSRGKFTPGDEWNLHCLEAEKGTVFGRATSHGFRDQDADVGFRRIR